MAPAAPEQPPLIESRHPEVNATDEALAYGGITRSAKQLYAIGDRLIGDRLAPLPPPTSLPTWDLPSPEVLSASSALRLEQVTRRQLQQREEWEKWF